MIYAPRSATNARALAAQRIGLGVAAALGNIHVRGVCRWNAQLDTSGKETPHDKQLPLDEGSSATISLLDPHPFSTHETHG
jgi:hypothetical protein